MFSSIHVQLSLAQVASSRLVDAEGRVSFLAVACQPHFLPFALPTSTDPAVRAFAGDSFEEWNGDAPDTSARRDLEDVPSSTDLDETSFPSSASSTSSVLPTLRRSYSVSSLASSTGSSLFSGGNESTLSSFTSFSHSSNCYEVELASSSSADSNVEHSFLDLATDEPSDAPSTSSARSSRCPSRPSPSPSPLDRLPSPFASESPSKYYRREYLHGITKLTGELNALLPFSFAVEEEQVHGFYRRWCRA
ncbi:hypothetical protein JCM6882_003801 [Rhodosporidiobolus microsporus]